MFNWINSFPFAVCFHSIPNTVLPNSTDHQNRESTRRENHVIHEQLLHDAVFAICFMSFLEKKHKLLLLLGFPPVPHSLLTYSSRDIFPTNSFPMGP